MTYRSSELEKNAFHLHSTAGCDSYELKYCSNVDPKRRPTCLCVTHTEHCLNKNFMNNNKLYIYICIYICMYIYYFQQHPS